MSVPLLRRSALLLVLLMSSVYFGCATNQRHRYPPDHPCREGDTNCKASFCPPPNQKYFRPEITVTKDASNELHATPKVAVIWDVEPERVARPGGGDGYGRTRSGQPVTIVWRGPVGLYVVFDDNSCVTKPKCPGNGECTAMVKPLAADPNGHGVVRRCSYKMFTGEYKDDDGDVVINPCCW